MLELKHLGHRYPHATAPALADVSLAVPRGCVLGLLGPNGAGKTTLISHLSGALAVQSGEILIDGQPLQQVRAKTPTRIAVAPQDQAFYSMLTVAENLACFAAASRLSGARKRERIDACMRFSQLESFAGVRADRLSGGLKRRLNLAIALLPEPELMLFDEPTVGVDPQSRAFILDAIKSLAQAGAAVIYASHYMEEIEAIADRVAILDHGRVLREGSLDDLLSRSAMLLTLAADGLDVEMLSRFGTVEQGAAQWRIHLNPGSGPGPVLAALEASGIEVRHAEFGRHDLEQLFMALTHRSLRD
ncbi:ABC-2 type transport system ATP-binding protein [Variovorax boronicumulans]|uniref:ABC-2 type transport system ATP-binding protein n=1 Tax=Variovorax boronicumulans TaxID=436515 RepID=A0AAW8DDY6_9BURK|nr:ABC transporter ATP-binding protein [Variovorax boronicumulans]MDP9897575.1 ABC-2 type transport system ATP-binding protein [Variovorax boronicumulans]MDQ0057614.1 ABC-2 type transport system ATP-binding protein [Variovorax boronicumulans]